MSLAENVRDILVRQEARGASSLALQRLFQHISGHICLADSQTVFWDLTPEDILLLQNKTSILLAKIHTVAHLARPDH